MVAAAIRTDHGHLSEASMALLDRPNPVEAVTQPALIAS
jgi:hypothetical protein